MMKTSFPIYQNPESDGRSFFLESEKGNNLGIILFHGFTATTIEVRFMANYLHEFDFPVIAPLLPGHGTSPEDLNKTNYQDWIVTADNSFNQIHQHCEKIIVMGESMGGLLSIWLSIMHPEVVGTILFAPALIIPKLWQSDIFWPFIQYMKKKNIDLTSIWQGYNVVPLKGASELHAFQKMIKQNIHKLKTPLLIFQGEKDQTIDPKSSVEVFTRAGSKNKKLIWLENNTHCILLDNEIETVKQECISFIQKFN